MKKETIGLTTGTSGIIVTRPESRLCIRINLTLLVSVGKMNVQIFVTVEGAVKDYAFSFSRVWGIDWKLG